MDADLIRSLFYLFLIDIKFLMDKVLMKEEIVSESLIFTFTMIKIKNNKNPNYKLTSSGNVGEILKKGMTISAWSGFCGVPGPFSWLNIGI